MSALTVAACAIDVPGDDGDLVPAPSRSVTQGIVGGTVAGAGEWPAIVRLTRNGDAWCGGTLIDPTWVVTAAHCIDGVPLGQLGAVLGERDTTLIEGTEQFRAIAQVVVHPDYAPATHDNDIALLRLADPAAITAAVSPIFVIDPQDADVFLTAGRTSSIAGWGATVQGGAASVVLRRADLPVVANSTCNSAASYNGHVTGNMMCAGLAGGGVDTCQGDSGGPLLVAGRLAGLTSWGDGCAQPNKYGVYTRASRYYGWISGFVALPQRPGLASQSCTVDLATLSIECTATAAGGLAPLTQSWTLSNTQIDYAYTSPAGDYSYIHGTCTGIVSASLALYGANTFTPTVYPLAVSCTPSETF